MSEAHKALYRRLIDEAFNEGRLEVIDEAVDPALVLHGTSGERGRGPAALRAVVEELRAAFSGFHYDVHDLVAEGDSLAIRWSVHGVHTGSYAGFAASNREMNVSGMSVCRLRGGRIVESWAIWDVDAMKRQLAAR